MIKKIFLHIGSHKTGTTSIQRFLNENKKNLSTKQSIAYLNLKKLEYISTLENPLTQTLEMNLDVLEQLQNISEDYVIISDEEFSWINEKKDIEQLAKKLYGYAKEVEIIIYLRRQESLAISHKQQGAKGGRSEIAYGHERKALPTQLTLYSSKYLNFYEKIKKWSSVFGQNNLIVKIFEKEQLYHGDIVEDFCLLVGIKDYHNLIHVKKINESIARIPQLFMHQVRNTSKEIFAYKTKEKIFLIQQMRELSSKTTDKLLPSKEEAIAFYEQFKESNKKLNEWLGLTDKPFLFNDDFSYYPEEDNGYELSKSEVIEMFHLVMQNGLEDYIKKEKVGVLFLKLALEYNNKPISIREKLAYFFFGKRVYDNQKILSMLQKSEEFSTNNKDIFTKIKKLKSKLRK